MKFVMSIMLIESLRDFLHCNLALNLLSGKFNQKLRHTKPIYILQTNRSFPRLGSLFTTRLTHFYVCIKVNHIAMLIITQSSVVKI